MKIVIIIRVYNRIWDLMHNLEVISRTWTSNDYDIIIVSNGTTQGFQVPDISKYKNCTLITINSNSGHFSGNSELLIEGVKNINLNKYDYVVLLEADTWLYGDNIVLRYTEKLKSINAVWASAKWFDKFHSLATDFAIVNAMFLNRNIEVFNFTQNPECEVFNYLEEKGYTYIYIKENMPVMLPSYIKKYPYAPKGRFYVFLKSKMVTHHIENYPNNTGKYMKLKLFNTVANYNFFNIGYKNSYWIERLKIFFFKFLQYVFIRRSWYSKITQSKKTNRNHTNS